MAIGSFKEAIDSLIITIFLGFFFVFLQALEYYEAPFIIQIVYMVVLFIC